MRSLLILALLILAPAAFAGQFDDKTEAWFEKKYGKPKFIRVETAQYFQAREGDHRTIKGMVSVQMFQDSDVHVTAIFFHPSRKLAKVTLQRRQNWTTQETNAALTEYGGKWKVIIGGKSINKLWEAPDGSLAFHDPGRFIFQSKAATDLANKDYAEYLAKRDAAEAEAAKKPAGKP